MTSCETDWLLQSLSLASSGGRNIWRGVFSFPGQGGQRNWSGRPTFDNACGTGKLTASQVCRIIMPTS